MPQKQPDHTDGPLSPKLLRELDDAVRKLQERIALHSDPEHRFALIHLVEGLPIDAWAEIAQQLEGQRWLALPLDKEEGVPLYRLREILEDLAYQRDHDTLTGLANRRLFNRQIAMEMQRSLRTNTPLSLAMLDIDNFKDVNDAYGHPTGDKVLVALGDLLTRSLRVYDLAARVGGEEFCLLLPGAATRQAADMAQRVLEDFREIPFETPEGQTFHVTFSAGVSTAIGGAPAKWEDLFAEADALLYDAKNKGKNCVVTAVSRHRVSENPAMVQAAEKQFLFTGEAQ